MRGELRPDKTTVVQRLRIRAVGGQCELAESRVRALVSVADLAPPAMPAQAILIVRRFGRGLPALALSSERVQPPADWQRAVSDGMSALANRAARPSRGAVQADAEAVWFDDRAEMLTCIALDWMNGVAGSRWWWQALFRNVDLERHVPDVWRESPEYVPAAMEQLASWRAAVRFVQGLGAQAANRVLLEVTRVFSLRALELVIRSIGNRTTEMSASIGVDDGAGRHAVCSVAGVEDAAAPWAGWVGEADASNAMEPEGRLLLAICLMLRRAPTVVRKESFAMGVAAWMNVAAAARTPGRSPSLAMETAIPEKAAAPLVDRQWLTEPARAISQQFRADGQPARNPVSGVAIRPPAPGRDIAGTPIVPEAESSKGPLAARTVHAPEAQRPYAEPGVDALRSELPAVAEIPDAPLPSPALGAPLGNMRTSAQMKTSYGGVFYLINLGLFLGFYGDFTTPDEPGIELPIWDFIALIGRDLAGAAIEDDPVWSMLADLANRKLGEEPGAGYQNWFLEQTPKMRARLMLALGLESKDELGPLLLRHEATVLLTPTHLDIFFRLQDHPIEIRCSGLDRDPGWTPAAARYIAFHFE